MFVAVDDNGITLLLRNLDADQFVGEQASFLSRRPAAWLRAANASWSARLTPKLGRHVVGCLRHGIDAELRLHPGLTKRQPIVVS